MVSVPRPSFSKCEIAGIGSLKDAKVAGILWTEKFRFNQREH